MSADLIWECVKKDSSFIRGKFKNILGNPVFNAEPANLMGLHSKKFSGLCGKVLDVKAVRTGKKEKVMLVTSHARKSRSVRPNVMHLTTGLSKAPGKANAALEKKISGGYYRRDLLELAKIKYAKIKTSFRKSNLKKTAVVKSRRAGK